MSEPKEMMAAVSASMNERTGRTLEEWVAQVTADGLDPLDQNTVRRHLKERYDLLQNTQWTIADAAARAAGWTPPTTEQSVDGLYSGKKSALRPLHDAVAALALELEGAEAQARGTYIPFVRKTQFAAVAPGPRNTLRIGFRFRDGAPAGTDGAPAPTAGAPDEAALPDGIQLEPAKGFAQATHWVHLPNGTDPTSIGWLRPLLHAGWEQNG